MYDERDVCCLAGAAVCHLHAPGHTGGVSVLGAGWPVRQGCGRTPAYHQGTGKAVGDPSGKWELTHPEKGDGAGRPPLFVPVCCFCFRTGWRLVESEGPTVACGLPCHMAPKIPGSKLTG